MAERKPKSTPFGQRRPPLSVTIKSILDRYPDGQIFKEVIQNADDAGASTVKFFLDCRQHGTTSLIEPGLAQYQGPALLAYNDATFSDDDWEGIQNLQRSIKADDPFKVGKFGIGFNSVYHITDCPSIVSGSKLAYLEPQEKIWKGEAGKKFDITDVYNSRRMDALQPFKGVCEFAPGMASFPGTTFRFPLRTSQSEMSDNLYTLQQLRKLLSSLREEAKFLLLFLRSVINIEVYELNDSSRTLSFSISIQEQAVISHQRSQFMELTHASHSSGTSQPLQLLSEFHVNVSDQHSSEPKVSHWLVLTRVGSSNHDILRLAQAQNILPWVGAALELHPSQFEKYPAVQGGRIFCFLPMPIEASSPFPIHINGTFGLSDDRRSLKWSGPERQNDPTAKWNEVVVSSLLPQCYIELLMSAQKYLKHNEFYLALPEVSEAKDTPWESLLQPFFASLFCKDVVWTEKRQALQVVGEWIQPRNGIFIPQDETLPSAIRNALSSSNIQLISIPTKVWEALRYCTMSVTKVNPRFARNCLRKNKHSYASIDRISKFEILRYCLSDGDYNDLHGLCLLPLADKISWVDIVHCAYYPQVLHYLCTEQCPAFLLPNQQHILVNVLGDEELEKGLMAVTRSGTTQLRELTVQNVAQLLPKSFPGEWQSQQIVSVPHFQFPMDWFEKFWRWIDNKALSPFAGQPLIPVRPAGSPPASFQVARLNKKSNILYIPQHVPTPQELLSALDKLRALYSKQVDFPFLVHVELTNYLAVFNSNGILDAINCSPHILQQVSFSKEEANSMKVILVTPQPSLDARRQQVLQNLKLFTTMTNSKSKLCSVSECASSSLLKAAIKVPANFFLRIEYVPSNALIFSDDYHQTVLLGLLQSRGLVSAPNNANFLLQYIFPLIPSKLGRNVLNNIMEDVLNQLPLIRREGYLPNIVSALKNLQFIEDKFGLFHRPSELYDPSIRELQQLFLDEPVFPILPFREDKYLFHLRDCGLCQSVQPQDIINIVHSIALPRAAVPQKVGTTKLSRARAVLKYISGCPPHLLQSQVTIPGYSGTYTFQSALQHFASNQSWLPVCSSPPEGYPQGLVWKGNLYNSHFVSLDNSTVVLFSTQNSTSLPLIIGSQVYVVYTQVSSQTSMVFSMDKSTQVTHVIAHFKEVIKNAEQVPVQEMERVIHSMYNYLNVARQTCLQSQSQLQTLRSIPRWIWLKKKQRFISPNLVAAADNESFTHIHVLEPYIFLLPDELSQYTELFVKFGMPRRVSNSQIVSVLQTIKSSDQTVLNTKQTWEIVMSILNWLTKYGEEEASLPDGCTLYVPIESDSATPVLMDANEVAYTDNAFLKTYLASVETEESYTCVHQCVYLKLAQCLGLSSLSDYLDITEDTFEDAGQYESLTVRLKNILRDYKDGLTIIKELVQNADDAEATEVNICYDSRTIQVNSKALFFPGMADAHGPALVVHNNAVFSKDDLENITKLAGATKQDKPLKIGKFGIGFCSVYHITDVPSFVSQDTLCIFDPTLSYLRKEIKNPARPGKRVKFTAKLIAASKQLVPYDGLFGFKHGSAYEGTLFRFPFRTHFSELSSTVYTDTMVKDLYREIFVNASKLLLFLQNVKKITFSSFNQGDQSPTTLFKVEKYSDTVPHAIAHTIQTTRSSGVTTREKWLVTTKTDRVQLKSDTAKLKCCTASVACQLAVSEVSLTLMQPKAVQGEVFCFLPLARETGLPVHISANFAVMNNRREIWTSAVGLRNSFEVEWNEELIRKIIPSAYYELLLALRELELQGKLENYKFYSLWPLEMHLPWSLLTHTVYQSYLQSSELFYSSSVNQWLTVNKSKFLAKDILTVPSSNSEPPQCVLSTVKYLQLPLVHLQEKYQQHLNLKSSIVTEKIFISLFFEMSTILSHDLLVSTRNNVLCLMLEVYAMELDTKTERYTYLELYLKSNPCVPCVPDGKILRHCSSVVDVNAPFATLFDVEENMFPIRDFTEKKLVHIALQSLGMLSQYLPWYYLIERAQTVQNIYGSEKARALSRAQQIIQCIELTCKNVPDKTDGLPLSKIPFLPVMHKPKGYPIHWYGEACTLVCGSEAILQIRSSYYRQSLGDDVANIAGSQVVVLNTEKPTSGGCGVPSDTACKLLSIQTLPSTQNVVNQLMLLIETFQSLVTTPTVDFIQWIDQICRQAYAFLDKQLKASEKLESVVSVLVQVACIWMGKYFISPQVVAEKWSCENGPYLFKIPSQLAIKESLIKVLGVKENFSLIDIISALSKVKDDFESTPVDESARDSLFSMIYEVGRVVTATGVTDVGTVMLPDTAFVMHQACDLAYNDAPWCKPDDNITFMNEKISRELALQLGVKPVRSKMLKKYASKFSSLGIEFGQREDLTRRIQNILRGYPFDVTVLKELLQNADDAKASKLWIILDKRTHTNKGILSDNWKHLQGPALLVWNDSTFSGKDLEGIQSLGLGSKRSESESIGQYGIGFNVVYHLTDCPSFITAGETLCVFDPHCCYVDGADHLSPGRRIDVTSGFWDEFPGMKSAFLQEGLQHCPAELMHGSLFRFPLRHTQHHIDTSEILDHSGSPRPTPLTARDMHHYLKEWAPYMKKALLFLNNVKELNFWVIDEADSCFKLDCSFQVQLDEEAVRRRKSVHDASAAFTQKTGNSTCVERYCINTTEYYPSSKSSGKMECWLIQQGVGDICDESIHWEYISRVKPRHGIAVLLPETCKKDHHSDLIGEVFCFLPLPIKSNLPVHVNGHFILDDTRRDLWKSTQPDHVDDRGKWNENLLSSISSSYANLLMYARDYFTLQHPSKYTPLDDSLNYYYSIFPRLSGSKLEGVWRKLAEDVYRRLDTFNAPVLATINPSISIRQQEQTSLSLKSAAPTATSRQFYINWHKIHSVDSPSAQVHFFKVAESVADKKQLKSILQQIGMNVASAPLWIMNCFDNVKVNIPATDPKVVFLYYTTHCHFTDSPKNISKTPFETVLNFKLFSEYIVKKCDEKTYFACSGQNEFYGEPFGYHLLLTADCKLRKFTDTKVIRSCYCHLFPQSEDAFLHAELLKLDLKQDYFITAKESEQNFSIVDCLLSKSLPHCFKATKVQRASRYMEQKVLMKMWTCIETDPVFNVQLENILKYWALLLTTNDDLFSCPSQNCLLPVLKSCDDDDPMYHFLRQIKMPFLAEGIIMSNKFCPKLQDHNRMLQNMFYLHQEHDISHFLSTPALEVLVNYLRNINFRTSPDSVQYLHGLPIFEDVDKNLTTLSGHDVYVWPDNVCPSGWKKWIEGKNIIFLNPRGFWHKISSEEIGIRRLPAEVLYVLHIFPQFSKLNVEERYQQLKHIRDHMFQIAQIQKSSATDKSKRRSASNFIYAMENLPCIGNDGEKLHCISEFYDHREEIFTTFKKHFLFLPIKLLTNNERKWMEFLCELGLQTIVTMNKFLQLCSSVARGEEENIQISSSVLLRYLLPPHFVLRADYVAQWHRDSSFLSRVSQIQFVCIKKVTELTWIASSCCSSGSGTEILTTLRGTADIEHEVLLWTMIPIIELPPGASIMYPGTLQSLGIVTTPKMSDVIANIIKISLSKFADPSLFDRYPENYRKPNKSASITDVLLQNYNFLESQTLNDAELQQLSSCQCIPVYADPKAQEAFKERFVVLVNPDCVVTSIDATTYFPLLHVLPHKMFGCADLLDKIGVKSTIGLKHLSHILSKAFEHSEEMELEPNMNEAVGFAIKHLYGKLKEIRQQKKPSMSVEMISEVLTPLYLPTAEKKLCLSTSLLYCDSTIYTSMKIDLSETELRILNIPCTTYDFNAEQLCLQLPSDIRPRTISQCCEQVISSTSLVTRESEVAMRIKESLAIPSLSKTLILIVGVITKDSSLKKKFKEFIEKVLTNVCIQSVDRLQTSIRLTVVEPHKVIGCAAVNYHIQEDSDGKTVTIYLDSNLPINIPGMFLQPIIEYFITHIKQLGATTENTDMSRLNCFFEMALQGRSRDDHMLILQTLDPYQVISLDVDDYEFKDDVKPCIGKLVPRSWHHRLVQDFNNFFHSEEWVGYEDVEDHIIFAQIVCPVMSEGAEMPLNFLIMYKILIKEDDDEGIEVCPLKLYKFSKGKKIVITEAHSMALVSYEGEITSDGILNNSTGSEEGREELNMKKIKIKLCKELNIIWRLPIAEKKQAIRRLYLKWHPDKNLDIPKQAEEIFTFIRRQVERLENGLPLENPECIDHAPPRQSGSSDAYHSQWGSYFRRWDETANQHKNYAFSEERFQQSGGGGGGGWWQGRGGGGGGDEPRPSPNPSEGRRWLRQAADDCEALRVLHSQLIATPEIAIAGHVCFMAHQVAEKALKGGKYIVCGLGDRGLKSHNLTNHAYALQLEKQLYGLSSFTAPLENYYLDTRYPNRVPPPQTPSEKYTVSEADKAKRNAEEVLKMMRSLM